MYLKKTINLDPTFFFFFFLESIWTPLIYILCSELITISQFFERISTYNKILFMSFFNIFLIHTSLCKISLIYRETVHVKKSLNTKCGRLLSSHSNKLNSKYKKSHKVSRRGVCKKPPAKQCHTKAMDCTY